MIYPFRKTIFNCRQATYLSVKREEGTVTLLERVKLGYHLLYCEPCRRFIQQWELLKQTSNSKTFFAWQPPYSLSDQAKEKIRRQLSELNS